MLTCAAVSGGDQALVISPELYMPQTAGTGPIHTAHAVADLNQSDMRNAAIFSAIFLAHTLVSQTTARPTLTQCVFVVFGSIAHSKMVVWVPTV